MVADDTSLTGVDEEHSSGLQAALLDDARGRHVDDPDLAGHHDQVVVRYPVAAGPQAVAVENRSDDRAVGEGNRRRAIPGLHQGGVVLVEGTPVLVHRLVALPGLRDHHHHRLWQGIAAEGEEFQCLVEGGGVTRPRGADREQAVEVAGQEIGCQEGLTGPHPVAVALHRVDFAVVGDHPVGVGQRPGREGVRREAGVDESEGAFDPAVGEVRVELGQLRCGEHPLVDDGSSRQRREVDAVLGLAGGSHAATLDGIRGRHVDLVLGAPPQAVDQSVEGDAARPAVGALRSGDEELPEDRCGALRRRPDDRVVHGHLSPAEDLEPLLDGDLPDPVGHQVGLPGIPRQEGDARGIGALRGEVEVDDLPVEAVGHLEEDAGPVTRVLLGAEGTAVLELAECADAQRHDVVAAMAPEVTHEVDTTGIVLEPRVVQALGGGDTARAEDGCWRGHVVVGGESSETWCGCCLPPGASSVGAGSPEGAPGRSPMGTT